MKIAPVTAIATGLAIGAFAQSAAAATLDIYFIDVEGGQATLIATPQGETLLIDSGFAGSGPASAGEGTVTTSHASRIAAAARDAGAKQIDYALITHFHADHDGGIPELAQSMRIGTFVDHGVVAEAEQNAPRTMDPYNAYAAVRAKGRHIEPKPGDRLPLKGIDVTVVSSAAATLARPLAGAGGKNAACEAAARPADDPNENARSTGIVVTWGKFRFLDLGDLTGRPLYDLACPNDLIGQVDAYLVAHHGGADAAKPETFAAFKPRVAILNNGARKGGAPAIFAYLHQDKNLKDVWQLHRSEAAGNANFANERIANVDESTAHWIKLSANEDGSFRVLNGRTAQWTSYGSR